MERCSLAHHAGQVNTEDYVLAENPSLLTRVVVASTVVVAGIIYASGSRPSTSGAQLWQASLSTSTQVAASRDLWFHHGEPDSMKQYSRRSAQVLRLPSSQTPDFLRDSGAWKGNAVLSSAAAFGAFLGAGLVALFRRLTERATHNAAWHMGAVAPADVDAKLDDVVVPESRPIPPIAGKEVFRPDLFKPRSEPRTIIGSDIKFVKKRTLWFPRTYNATDWVFIITTFGMHAIAFILGPMTYRPDCLALAFALYVVTGLFGITLSFHRQLSHRSFTTPKWLEYVFAYCGVLALQGDPLEWVSSHRYHHLYCETDRDPHTVYEGLWWSHMGWLLDGTATKARTGDQSNANDIATDPFYIFIQQTYPFHILMSAVALFAWGGLPYLVWGVAVRTVFVWHITWFVNSAAHAWGSKTYKTSPPDESRNNWWVALLAWGEGWHNNHHAFQYSARHGLEWWQFDMTWYVIRTLQFLGLASNVKLPSKSKRDSMRLA